MKKVLRGLLINGGALWVTASVLPGLVIIGGVRGLLVSTFAFMLMNFILVPLIKILFLPLNLLTLGVFSWLTNVLALYFLVTILPSMKILPYSYPGWASGGFVIPAMDLSSFQVTVLASILISIIVHFIYWLMD